MASTKGIIAGEWGVCQERTNCGKRGGYVLGCRGDACKIADREYTSQYRKKKRGSDGWIDIDEIKKHLKFLVKNGMSIYKIAHEIGTSPRNLHRILYHPKAKRAIDGPEWNKLLSISLYNKELLRRGHKDVKRTADSVSR